MIRPLRSLLLLAACTAPAMFAQYATPVRDVDQVSRKERVYLNAGLISFGISAGNSYRCLDLYTVPANKKFVLQFYSVHIQIPVGQVLSMVNVGSGFTNSFFVAPQLSGSTASDQYYSLTQPLGAVYLPGETISNCVFRDGGTNGEQAA